MNELKEISNIAAKWWADVICDPKMDNGANDIGNMIANYLAKKLVKNITGEKKEAFYNRLSGVIYEELGKKERVMLSVDYNPCMTLYNTGIACDIPETNFPIKTTMWINRNSVRVSYGYRAEIKTLYANKQYYLDQIKNYEDCIYRYTQTDEYDFLSKERIEESVKEFELEIDSCKDKLKNF